MYLIAILLGEIMTEGKRILSLL